MSGVDKALLVGLVVALVASYGHKRAWGWLLAVGLSYAVSTLYWRSGMAYPSFIAGLCDALICLGVYFFGRQKWEMWVWRLFQVSVGINLLYLAGNLRVIPPIAHNDYSVILETINWIALAFIGGTGLVQTIGAHDARATGGLVGRIRRIAGALSRKRKDTPFHLRAPR